nr:protein SPT2 homolog [Helicoverpa armigera]
MEFRETLLAAQRNQQQKSSENAYYKARFDPPKKEQKQRDRLSANIQKFLAKKDEEERQKKIEAQRKREELLAMRDPKALRKIQKTLKVIKSANKSVIADAIDRDNTAVTREGPEQPDQDDYGYESQEAAAIYEKMMEKYSKLPDEPKFPVGNTSVKKDLNGTRERVKHALKHEDDPVPHKRRRRGENGERESSPPTRYEPEKDKKESKPDKPKFRKPAPPPMDFNQLLKLAEQKKSEPIEIGKKKEVVTEMESGTERLMTKKQKREYEEEMARRQRRQERLEAEKSGARKVPREDRPREAERERKPEPSTGLGRIPKVSDKLNNSSSRNDSPRPSDRERSEREKIEKLQKERDRLRLDKEKAEREKERLDKERLDKLRAERERIERDIDRLNRDREKLEKAKSKLESSSKLSDKGIKSADKSVDRSKLSYKDGYKQDVNKNIDLKSQNTYRIDKNSNERRNSIPSKQSDGKLLNGHSKQGKPVPKTKEQSLQQNGIRDKQALLAKQRAAAEGSQRSNDKRMSDSKGVPSKRPDDRKVGASDKAGPSKPKVTNTFDFDKHINCLGKNGARKPDGTRQFPPADVKRKGQDPRSKKRRALDSDSEYDSELDDFIDDGDDEMDYSKHIKEIFGYDKSKYRDMDDDDDPTMESSFARQQREEYISKKIGIMEDLEDMRLEAEQNKKKKKGRRISDD